MYNAKSITILMVEDEALTARLQTRLLQDEGYTVQSVSSGEAALEYFQSGQSSCDLVLMDLDLGKGMDGTHTASLILELVDVPIIFLSSHSEPDIIAKTAAVCSSYGYLIKESPPSVIFTSIKMALRLYESRQAIKNLAKQERQLRDDLALQKAVLSGVLESSDTGIFALDRNYCYLSFNQAHVRFMKRLYNVEIQLGHSLYEYQTVTEDASKSRFNLDRCLAGEQFTDSAFSGDDSLSRLYIEVGHNPIRNEAGAVIGASLFARDISDRKQAEDQVQALLKEKELLLHETHHRVKNNLNTVYSLLNIKAEMAVSGYDRESLREAACAVQAMLLLYNKLYCVDSADTYSLADYVRSLTSEIVHSFASLVSVHVNFDIAELKVSPTILPTIGIIINELMTNSIKYAFRGRRRGDVYLSAHALDGLIEFIYKDDGPGMSAVELSASQASGVETDSLSANHFGLRLVGLLVKQLHGTLEVENDCGACFRFRFSPELT